MDFYRQNQQNWLRQRKNDNVPVIHGFTVDPVECRDRDDGLNYKQLDNDIWQVNVAIAHVPATVPFDSKAYHMASQKIRSFYFLNGRSPNYMLPADITEEMCSLNQGQFKPAIGIEFNIDLSKNQLTSHVSEIVFHADKNMNYSEFATCLEKKDAPLIKLAEFVKNRRLSLLPHNPDAEKEEWSSDIAAHNVIEEFMKITNHALPALSYQKNEPYLYRLGRKSSEGGSKGGFYSHVPIQHADVGYTPYSHSSSPIRRLPDLCNHYNMAALLNNRKAPLSNKYLENIADKANIHEEKYRYKSGQSYDRSHITIVDATNSLADFFKPSGQQQSQRQLKRNQL